MLKQAKKEIIKKKSNNRKRNYEIELKEEFKIIKISSLLETLLTKSFIQKGKKQITNAKKRITHFEIMKFSFEIN